MIGQLDQGTVFSRIVSAETIRGNTVIIESMKDLKLSMWVFSNVSCMKGDMPAKNFEAQKEGYNTKKILRKNIIWAIKMIHHES